jgi:nitrogen fixation protein NifQ
MTEKQAPLQAHSSLHACLERAEALLANTASPGVDARLFATLLAAREVRGEMPLLGIGIEELRQLGDRHFGPALGQSLHTDTLQTVALPTAHRVFVSDLHDLLMCSKNPEVNAADAACLATIIAFACLRPDHLWRDLGLTGREDVTRMLGRYFPTVVSRNVNNLRWKKFLAFEVAVATGREPGPAPGCPGCEDFGVCFVPILNKLPSGG